MKYDCVGEQVRKWTYIFGIYRINVIFITPRVRKKDKI